MRPLVAAAAVALAACTPGQAQVAADLLTPPEARCAEARQLYAELEAMPHPQTEEEMVRLRVGVLFVCSGLAS